ncbi:MAG: hypothetical protein IKF53_06600 [Clostridia bacterium]|nr:hypothetical protein [Clostridia bacterium]
MQKNIIPKSDRELESFLIRGFDIHTPQDQVLELLLRYTVPKEKAKIISAELLERYKTLAGVMDAPIEELSAIKGLGVKAAALLKLIVPIANIYSFDKSNRIRSFSGIEDIDRYLFERMRTYENEKVGMLILTADGKFKDFVIISEGSIDSVGISIREIMRICFEKGANIIALAHNHPSGLALPSPEDAALTEQIETTLSGVNVKLLDHVIVVNDDYVSMALSKEYSHIFRHKI